MSKNSIAEYMKIRRHIISLVYKAGSNSILLPSILELTEKFKVSRPTVSKAMRSLTQEGFVIGKRGIGSFSNPFSIVGNESPIKKQLPSIGVIFADGMAFSYSQYQCMMLGTVLQAVATMPAAGRLINLTSNDKESIIEFLLEEGLDGLVWCYPSAEGIEICERLSSLKIPIVICETRSEKVSSVCFDFFDAGYQCGKKLLAAGRRNIVYFPYKGVWKVDAAGLIKAYEEAGCPLDESKFLDDFDNAHVEVREMLERGEAIDGIYSQLFIEGELEHYLLSYFPSLKDSCTMVKAEMLQQVASECHSLGYKLPFIALGQHIIRLLKQACKGDFTAEKVALTIEIQENNKK